MIIVSATASEAHRLWGILSSSPHLRGKYDVICSFPSRPKLKLFAASPLNFGPSSHCDKIWIPQSPSGSLSQLHLEVGFEKQSTLSQINPQWPSESPSRATRPHHSRASSASPAAASTLPRPPRVPSSG